MDNLLLALVSLSGFGLAITQFRDHDLTESLYSSAKDQSTHTALKTFNYLGKLSASIIYLMLNLIVMISIYYYVTVENFDRHFIVLLFCSVSAVALVLVYRVVRDGIWVFGMKNLEVAPCAIHAWSRNRLTGSWCMLLIFLGCFLGGMVG